MKKEPRKWRFIHLSQLA